MTDMIPAVKAAHFPPRNRSERKPSFPRTLAASYSTDDEYVYGFNENPHRTLVPLSLAEMLASPGYLMQEDTAETQPAAAGPADYIRISATLTGISQATHTTDEALPHEIDNEA